MSSPVIVAKPSSVLAHVRNLMLRYRIGRVVIIDDLERPVGIITKNDLLKAAEDPLNRRSLDSILAEEVMTRNPVTVTYNRSIREAARLMLHHNIGGLPVVNDDGKLVGVITKTDVVRAYAERLRGKYKAKDYMYADPPLVTPQHSMSYVIDLLSSHPSRRVLVIEGKRLLGIIAPSDLAFLEEFIAPLKGKAKRTRRFARLPKGRIGPVYSFAITLAGDIMTPDPVTASPEEDMAIVASYMLRGGFSSVPIVSDDEPVGIVVKHNILEAIIGK
jgi:CBS domain-containing protein